MSKIKVTFPGFQSAVQYVKYDSISIGPSGIMFLLGTTVVGKMDMPKIDLALGDALTLSGIKGKIKVKIK